MKGRNHFYQYDVILYHVMSCQLSNPKTEHTTNGSGRKGARRGGGAGWGGARRESDGQDEMLTVRFAQVRTVLLFLQEIEYKSPECRSSR